MTGDALALAHILLVEDDPGDVAFTLDELREYRVRNHLTVLSNGLDAINYLEGRGRYAGAPVPDVLLLDLNLPGADGRTVLECVRGNPNLGHLTVALLTSSQVEEQMLRDFGVQAEFYFRKPVDFTHLVDLIRGVEHLGFVVDRVG